MPSFINIPNLAESWKNPVATSSELPTYGNSNGDARVALDTQIIYIWSEGTNTWIGLYAPDPDAVHSINSQDGSSYPGQTLVVGNSGSDFNIVSALGVHTFNIPTASATVRGVLSTTDWSTFNSKQAAGDYATSGSGDVSWSAHVGSGAVTTTIGNKKVTAAMLSSGAATSGYIATADGAGGVTYEPNSGGGGGSGLNQLTGDVTAGPGTGSQAATVVLVGGSSAANVHAAELLANAATSANTANAIVKRGASGEFTAGVVTGTQFIAPTFGYSDDASAGAGDGVSVSVQAQNRTGGTGDGGSLVISGGDSLGGDAGTVTVVGGDSSQIGGSVSITGGVGTLGGGIVFLQGGNSTGVTEGGAANVTGGSNTTAGGVGGNTTIAGGTGDQIGGSTYVTGGWALGAGGTGGDVIVVPGSGDTGGLFKIANASGTVMWHFSNDGHFLADIDNSYDIGASGATRPRTIYAGTSVVAPSFVGALAGNASTSTTATNFSGSLSGDVTGTQSATAISAATVVGKLLASFSSGGSLPITSADSILVAFQKLNAALVPITAAEYNAGNSGSSITISWSNGNAQLITLNSATPTINLPAPVSGQNYILRLMQDGTGSRVPTLTPASGSVKYSNNVAPTWTTTAGKYDLVTLYADGTNYTASVGFNY